MSMTKYKWIAAIGIIIMGIGSVMSCLSSSVVVSHIGSVILLCSILLMAYAFYHWRP